MRKTQAAVLDWGYLEAKSQVEHFESILTADQPQLPWNFWEKELRHVQCDKQQVGRDFSTQFAVQPRSSIRCTPQTSQMEFAILSSDD